MKGIKYISHVGTSGYAECARQYILGLAHAGIPITWSPIIAGKSGGKEFEIFTGTQSGETVLDPFCNRVLDYDTVIIHAFPRVVPFLAQSEPGKKIFVYSVWETDRLPKSQVDVLNSLDAVIVPCAWNRAVFQASGVQAPVYVVPHLFSGQPAKKTRESGAARSGDFIFYTINTWTARKGIEALLEVYLQTFTAQDNVVLVVKTDPRGVRNASLPWLYMNRVLDQVKPLMNRFSRRMRRPSCLAKPPMFDAHLWLHSLQSVYPNPPPVELITEELSAGDISMLHQRGDCFVSLSKGEGWGLGAFYAAGHGNCVIMTGFGGQLDYLDNENAYLVDYRLTPARDDFTRNSVMPDQNWAEADKQHASRLMKHVYSHQEEARAKAARLQRRILLDFGAQAVIHRFLEVLTQGRCTEGCQG